MKILIIGAGIGGLAAARVLLADGHDVRVFEASEAPRTTGSALTLWSNGTGILSELGVRLDNVGAVIERIEHRAPDGRLMIGLDVSRAAERYGHPHVMLPRRRLIELLADGLPPGVVTYGRPCVRVGQDGPGGPGLGRAGARVRADARVWVEFADGTTTEGDLLIGADGRRSVVRDHLWGADPARPGGWVTLQSLAPIRTEVTSSRRAVMHVGKEGLVGLMPAGEGLLQWWCDVRWMPGDPLPGTASAPTPPPAPAPARGRVREVRAVRDGDPVVGGREPLLIGRGPVLAEPGPVLAELRRRFGGWASPVPEVLAAFNDAEIEFFPHYRHRVPRVWGEGAMTLVGDAAHSMPPTRAQGANQTLEDVWALVSVLRRAGASGAPGGGVPDNLAGLLRSYERKRSKKAAFAARKAGTEDTNEYRPVLYRMIPKGLAPVIYTRWLEQVSDYLVGPAR